MKPNKRQYIDFIIDELNKGNVHYKEVMLAFVSKFELTEQTFVRYWKSANAEYSAHRESVNKQKAEESIRTETAAAKSLVLDKYARMKIAESIALGKAKRVEGQIIMPSPSDQLKALDYLAKIDGDYAPAKIANTDSEGKDVAQLNIIAPVGLKLEFPNNTDGADT
jgi:hypothetical protein